MTRQQTQPATDQTKENPPSSPSGATDHTTERVKKFDEEGGDQAQAPTQQAVDDELARARQAKA
jgi:hypothetical protein